MQSLHLVGFTPDRRGLILSTQRGGSARFLLEVDAALLEQLASVLDYDADRTDEVAVEPAGRQEAPLRAQPVTRSASSLSPREMQARLRSGASLAEVALAAGVDEDWVARFAAPVFAEQALAVERASQVHMTTPRRGRSGRPVAEAVARSLLLREVRLSAQQVSQGWSAYQILGSEWVVSFTYRWKGREVRAEWMFDMAEGVLSPRNRTASELGWTDPAAPTTEGAGRGRTTVFVGATRGGGAMEEIAPVPAVAAGGAKAKVRRGRSGAQPASSRATPVTTGATPRPAKSAGTAPAKSEGTTPAKSAGTKKATVKATRTQEPATTKGAAAKVAPAKAGAPAAKPKPEGGRSSAAKARATSPVAKGAAAKSAAKRSAVGTPAARRSAARRPASARAAGSPAPAAEVSEVEPVLPSEREAEEAQPQVASGGGHGVNGSSAPPPTTVEGGEAEAAPAEAQRANGSAAPVSDRPAAAPPGTSTPEPPAPDVRAPHVHAPAAALAVPHPPYLPALAAGGVSGDATGSLPRPLPPVQFIPLLIPEPQPALPLHRALADHDAGAEDRAGGRRAGA